MLLRYLQEAREEKRHTRLFPDRCQAEVDRRQLQQRLCAISPLCAGSERQNPISVDACRRHRSQITQMAAAAAATTTATAATRSDSGKNLVSFSFFFVFCFYNNFVHRHDAAQHTLTRTIFITRFASLADGDGDSDGDGDCDCDASSEYGNFDASCYDATWRLFY